MNKKKVRLVSLISFALGFLDAFFIYVLSTYFSQVSGSSNVGIFYLIGYSGVLLCLFFLHSWIRFMGKVRILYFSLAVTIVACALLTGIGASWQAIAVVFALIMSTNMTWVALDILLESYSKDQVSGRIRGLYLTIMNAGLLLAPYISVKTFDRYSFWGIFFALVIGYGIVFLVSLVSFRDDNKVRQKKISMWKTAQKMLKEKNLLRIYHISLAVEFFYALMIVYTPLHLRNLGFEWTEIGLIFTAMLIPFVLLQYPLGVLADKYFGEKELLIGSLGIAMLATATLPFLSSSGVVGWGIFLFLTRVGIAGIEILRDSYFFKQIDGNDMDVIAFFRTARPVANIFAAIVAGLTLLILPVASVFFIAALMLLTAFISTFRLKDTEVEQVIKKALAT